MSEQMRKGFRAALPFAFPIVVLGVSFGVLAEPLMGKVAPIAMSVIVYSGAAQFAGLSVLLSGGGAAAAVAAGVLMNGRYLPMGVAVAPWLHGGRLQRALEAQTMVDASWAIANQGEGRFDRDVLIGATIPQFMAWVGGTVIGVFGGAALQDPDKLGLDAIFPAFYLALLVGELRHGHAVAAAVLGGAIALLLLPVAPPGIPVLAAALAALIGLSR